MALHRATERGSQEAIAVGRNGELLEGSSSNLFIVREGAISTPRLEMGILSGITRRTVIELARQKGIPLSESVLYPTDLYAADEAFITSSTRELVPAVRVDGAAVGNGAPGPVTLGLLDAYRELARRSA
jgi:branched-chain amino acid aminotransferase